MSVSAKSPAQVIFTLEALYICASRYPAPMWFESFDCPTDGSWGVVSIRDESSVFLVDRQASEKAMLILISLGASGFFGLVPPAARAATLQRIHRIALKGQSKALTFPSSWSPFHADNKLTVFAYPHEHGNDRLIATVMGRPDAEIRDLMVTELTTEASPINLKTYKPDTSGYVRAVSRLRPIIGEAVKLWANPPSPEIASTIDLAAVSYGSVTMGHTYGSWLPHLSSPQRAFVTQDPVRSLKLRGPAGSGKTLALELKALTLAYDGARKGLIPRIAFMTHSWAMAEQVDESLRTMDEKGLAKSIDVAPLLTLAEDKLPPRAPGYALLGDDSYSGKILQLRLISSILTEFVGNNWLSFRRSSTEQFRSRVEAPQGSVEHDTFVWDLSHEFAGVIAANGILPGITALERYLQIERMPWMMPLMTEIEQRAVMQLYSLYVRRLETERHFTSDQVVGDYLNFLATFHWRAMRRSEGYDFIFVDELHLFNEQERLVFHHLTRDPDAFPILFMAVDPKQSPAETYVEFHIKATADGESSRANKTFGDPEDIDLATVYRYTPQILAFLQHLDGHFPALELGDEWGFSLQEAESEVASGPLPVLFRHPIEPKEQEAVIREALAARDAGRHVAVLCVAQAAFEAYCDLVSSEEDARFQIIQSRDDVDRMRYARRRSVVLSMPQFVAGLQFDTVILAGLRARFAQYAPHQGYELRRFVSSVYIGASRAMRYLQLHVTGGGTGVPQVIEAAVGKGLMRLKED